MERVSSTFDLARAEETARCELRTAIARFEDFPYETNAAAVMDRLRRYRDAWMNGRVRP